MAEMHPQECQNLARDVAIVVRERTHGSFEDGMTALACAVAIHLSYETKDKRALQDGAKMFGRQVAELAIFFAKQVH